MGRTIYICDECGEEFEQVFDVLDNVCPWCRADIREGDDGDPEDEDDFDDEDDDEEHF